MLMQILNLALILAISSKFFFIILIKIINFKKLKIRLLISDFHNTSII